MWPTMRRLSALARPLSGFLAAVGLALALPAVAGASGFVQDSLLQPPGLHEPQRGSIAGTLAGHSWSNDDVSQGSFKFPGPFSLSVPCSAQLIDLLPTYSPDQGLSVWGMGWSDRLTMQRTQPVGEVRFDASDIISSPWGPLVAGDDGSFYPRGMTTPIAAQPDGTGWRVRDAAGNAYNFVAQPPAATWAAAPLWYLEAVTSPTGRKMVLSYASGLAGPYLESVTWGLGDAPCARLTYVYEPLTRPIEHFLAGTKRSLDRRIVRIDVEERGGDGEFKLRRAVHFGHEFDEPGLAFFLSSVVTTYSSGESAPPVIFSYYRWSAHIRQESITGNSALEKFVGRRVGPSDGKLTSRYATLVDIDDDGVVDIEMADDYSAYIFKNGAYEHHRHQRAVDADPLCRAQPSGLSARSLMRMEVGDDEPLVVDLEGEGSHTRLRVCSRSGQLKGSEVITGRWVLGANTRLVDIDRDHRPDLVRVSPGEVAVRYSASGRGVYGFAPARHQALSPVIRPQASWIHDVNGDGVPDLISAVADGFWVWHGTGAGAFASQGRFFPLRRNGIHHRFSGDDQVFFLDANHDGMIDVLFLRRGRHPLLYINNGEAFEYVYIRGLDEVAANASHLVVADLTGAGRSALTFYHRGKIASFSFDTLETSLLAAVDDGHGNRLQFTYERPIPQAGLGALPVSLARVEKCVSGRPLTSQDFAYAQARRHEETKVFLGYQKVESTGPGVHEQTLFQFEGDLPARAAKTVARDLIADLPAAHTEFAWDLQHFRGLPYLRPRSQVRALRDGRGNVSEAVQTRTSDFIHPWCALHTTVSSQAGELTTQREAAQVEQLDSALHCLPKSILAQGRHPDRQLDFTAEQSFTYNAKGQQTSVAAGASGDNVVQQVAYDRDGRATSIDTAGVGAIFLSYFDHEDQVHSVRAPDEVVTEITARDDGNGQPAVTARCRGVRCSSTFFAYDGQERLAAVWDEDRGGSRDRPLLAYAYAHGSAQKPGRVETTATLDEGVQRKTLELFDGAGEPLGEAAFFRGAWQLPVVTRHQQRAGLVARYKRAHSKLPDDMEVVTFAQLFADGRLIAADTSSALGQPLESTAQLHEGVWETKTYRYSLEGGRPVVREQHSGHRPLTTTMSAAGLPVQIEDEEGHTTSVDYDLLNRISRIAFPDGSHHRIEYDQLGRIKKSQREGIACMVHDYVGVSELVGRSLVGDGNCRAQRMMTRTYDAAYRPILEVWEDLSSKRQETTVRFYDGDRPTGPRLQGQQGFLTGVLGPEFRKEWRYTAGGLTASETVILADWRQISTVREHWPDGATRSLWRRMSRPGGGAAIVEQMVEHPLDRDGRAVGLDLNGRPAARLAYDSRGHLHQVVLEDGSTSTLLRDPETDLWLGTRQKTRGSTCERSTRRDDRNNLAADTFCQDGVCSSRAFSYDERNYLVAAGDERYAYGPSGRQISPRSSASPIVRNDIGHLTQVGDAHLSYGPTGHLEKIRRDGADDDLTSFAYDEHHARLLARRGERATQGWVGEVLVEDDNMSQAIQAGGRTVALLDRDGAKLLLADEASTLLSDADGRLNLPTAFGGRRQALKAGGLVDFGGSPSASGLALVRMGGRDFSPEAGEFTTPDLQFLLEPGLNVRRHQEANLFGYARNNPYSFNDPGGAYAQAVAAAGAMAFSAIELGEAFTAAALHSLYKNVSGFDPVSVRRADEIEDEIHRYRTLEHTGNDDMRRWAASARSRLSLELDIARGSGDRRDWQKPNASRGNGTIGYNTWSQKIWGHTWTKHGAQIDARKMTSLARMKGKPQSQWMNNDIAREFLVDNAARMREAGGSVEVDLPAGVEVRIFMPDGRIITENITRVQLVPQAKNHDVFKSAYALPPG